MYTTQHRTMGRYKTTRSIESRFYIYWTDEGGPVLLTNGWVAKIEPVKSPTGAN